MKTSFLIIRLQPLSHGKGYFAPKFGGALCGVKYPMGKLLLGSVQFFGRVSDLVFCFFFSQ